MKESSEPFKTIVVIFMVHIGRSKYVISKVLYLEETPEKDKW